MARRYRAGREVQMNYAIALTAGLVLLAVPVDGQSVYDRQA